MIQVEKIIKSKQGQMSKEVINYHSLSFNRLFVVAFLLLFLVNTSVSYAQNIVLNTDLERNSFCKDGISADSCVPIATDIGGVVKTTTLNKGFVDKSIVGTNLGIDGSSYGIQKTTLTNTTIAIKEASGVQQPWIAFKLDENSERKPSFNLSFDYRLFGDKKPFKAIKVYIASNERLDVGPSTLLGTIELSNVSEYNSKIEKLFPLSIAPDYVDWLIFEPVAEEGADLWMMFDNIKLERVCTITLAVKATVKPVSCGNATDGGVVLNISGGKAPYTYIWKKSAADSVVLSTDKNIDSVGQGSYLVRVIDAGGCLFDSKPINITVGGDSTPPVLVNTITDQTVLLSENECSAKFPNLKLDYSDNCAVANVRWKMTGAVNAESPSTGINDLSTYSFPTGVTVVTFFAEDHAKNKSEPVSVTITVKDGTPPQTPILTNIDVECSGDLAYPTTTDACSGAVVGKTDQPLDFKVAGKYNILWVFEDASGNKTTASQQIIISDTKAPIVPILSETILNCGMDATPPVATDACIGPVLGKTIDPISYTTPGNYKINWLFEDNNGNKSTVVQDIKVVDNIAPIAPVLSKVSGNCSVTLNVPSAMDACMGAVIGTTTSPLVYSSQGTYTVRWIFDDGSGNISTSDQEVEVKDINKPTKPKLDEVHGACSVVLTPPTTVDDCSGTIVGRTSDPLSYNTTGTYIVNWSFDDNNGNIETAEQIVIVKDAVAPVAPILLDVVGQCEASVTVPTTTDGCSGEIIAKTSDPLYYNKQGSYKVTWVFTDKEGNNTIVAQNVIIKDTTKPVKPVLSKVIAECSVSIPAPKTTDACDGEVIGTTTEPLFYDKQGIYQITWTLTDKQGNSETVVQAVEVKDINIPKLPVLETVVAECSVTVEVPVAQDNCAGGLLATTTVPLSYDKQGTYIIPWYFNDGYGNTITLNQEVVIKDTKAPVPPVLLEVYSECSVELTAPTAQDECSGDVFGYTLDPVFYNKQGEYIVNWVFEDNNGNSSTTTQKVIIKDTTNPVDVVLPDLKGECSIVVSPASTVDVCGGVIIGTTNDKLLYEHQGEYVITWKFTDGNGNEITAPQKVIVKDTTPPGVPNIQAVIGDCSTSVVPPVTVDACAGTIVGTTTDPVSFSEQGEYVITWVFDDGFGNISKANQDVIVEDITPPIKPILEDVLGGCSATITKTPTTTDACSGVITGTTTDPLTYSQQGTYIVTWKFDDNNGNYVVAEQKVIVRNNIAPIPAKLEDITVESNATVNIPKQKDACGKEIRATTTDPLSYYSQGTYIITWKFDDGNGNVAETQQKVTVKDMQAPVAPILSKVNGQCSATVTVPTANDKTMGVITGTTTDPLTYSQQGLFKVTWTFDDGNGNKSVAIQEVEVKDTEAPIIPELVLVSGECSVSLQAPTALDACFGLIKATTTDPLVYSKNGDYVVTWIFNDGVGNISTAKQNVSVKDKTPPVTPILPDFEGDCTFNVIDVPVAQDLCVGEIAGTTVDPLSYNKQGTYLINWKFEDGNGNYTTANQKVIIKDRTAPKVPVLSDITGECVASATSVTTTDACAGVITGTTLDPLTYNQQGTHVITWSFDDGSGNVCTAQQKIIIKDTQAPKAPNLAIVEGECDLVLNAPIAQDDCDGTIIGTTNDPINYAVQGVYIVKWLFTDKSGNSSISEQKVIVKDKTSPVASELKDIVGECFANVVITPIAQDECKGLVHGTTTDPLTYNQQGLYVVTWIFDDGNGNISEAKQNVIVKDTSAPELIEIKDVIGQCYATVTAPIIKDACAGNIVGKTTDSLSYKTQGTHTVIWKFDDGNGNISTASQKVIVKDITAPVVPVLADVIGECTATATVPFTEDACSGKIIGTTTDPLTYNQQGTYIISWSFDDGNGNVSIASQKVIVKDNTKPVTPVLADVVGSCSATATIPSTQDECSGTILGKTTNQLTYTTQGEHIITWLFDDGNGNVSEAKQKVIVKDTTPSIKPVLENVVGECMVQVEVPTTTDACENVIVGTTIDPISYNKQGEYIVNWKFDDGNGNVITIPQKVIVKDKTAPVAPVIANVVGECSASVTAPVAQDNCSGVITGTTTDPLTYNKQGSYIVTWTFDDKNGNVSSATQTVVVKDITAPMAVTIPTAESECSVTITAPSTEDTCSGKIIGTTTSPLVYNEQGSYEVTWIFDDGNGNVSKAIQNVIVKDKTAPIIPVVKDIIAECSATAVAPTTSDLCGGVIVGTTQDPLTYNAQGTYVITWNFDDNNGNVSSVKQNVIVKDVTAPLIPIIKDAIGECSVVLTKPTTKDACNQTAIVGTTTDSLTYSKQGTYNVTWTFNDGFGNISTAKQKVIVKDITAPIVPELHDVIGECSVTVPVAKTTDVCMGDIIGTTQDPLSYSKQGVYVINWTFNDGNGNISNASQLAIVKDTVQPVVISIPDAIGECSAIATVPIMKDACMGDIQGVTSDPVYYTTQGVHIITWKFNDGNGNEAIGYQNVIVKDNTAPQAVILADVIGECSVSLQTPTTQDACMGKIEATTTDPLHYSTVGEYNVLWEFNDGNGNKFTANQKVIVKDSLQPIPPVLQDVNGYCSAVVSAPVAIDACTGSIVATTSSPLTYDKQGVYEILWSFTDASGNTSTAKQKVIVKDIEAPLVPVLADITAQCGTTIPFAKTTDVCSGEIVGTTTDSLSYNKLGSYIVKWNFNDRNGNNSFAEQKVIIIDEVSPEVPVLADVVGECSATVTVPTTKDACMGVIKGTTQNALTYTSQGVHIVVWEFNDGAGNIVKANQKVIVKDKTAPIAPVLAQLESECSLDVEIPYAQDECMGAIAGKTLDQTSFSINGSYSINWIFDDGNGNISKAVQNVIIRDKTLPISAPLPDIIGECIATAPIPTAIDNCSGLVKGKTTNTLTYTDQGEHTIRWTFADGNGNEVVVPQKVIITDMTPPEVPTLSDVVGECSASITVTPSAIDACRGVIMGSTKDPLSYNTQGVHIVTWTFDDGHGNISESSQKVIIKDLHPPDKINLYDLRGNCFVEVIPPTTTDNCGKTITATTKDPLMYNKQGTYSVVWEFNDGNNRYTTISQNVIVDDKVAPTPPVLQDAIGECSVSLVPPVAIDDCSGSVTGTTRDALVYTVQGEFVVTWLFRDSNGNVSEAKQNVIVRDNILPVAPVLADITGQCSVTVPIPVSIDACSGVIYGETSSDLTFTKVGTHSIDWSFSDGNGNVAIATQKVIIKDVIPPVKPILEDIVSQCEVSIPAPTTVDDCFGTVVGKTTANTVFNKQGTYVVNWSFIDESGNTTTASQKVTIKDNVTPINPPLKTITGECSVTIPNPVTTDNCSSNIQGKTYDPVSYNKPGTYNVNWIFNDGNGNTTIAIQQVSVTDKTAPIVPVLSDIEAECSYALIPPTAVDDCMGNIKGFTKDPISFVSPGVYFVTWVFDDGNGNKSSAIQKVTIRDTTPPVVPVLAKLEAECELTVIEVPTANDLCSGLIKGVTKDKLTFKSQGVYTINWTFKDSYGNLSSAIQEVVIKDTNVPTAPSLPVIEGVCAVTASVPKTKDACNGNIIYGTTTDPVTYTEIGSHVITWTFADGNGNLSTAQQTVVVQPTTVDLAQLSKDITAQCNINLNEVVNIKDKCPTGASKTTDDPLSYDKQGTYVVRWKVVDSTGAMKTISQNVVIKDTEAPFVPEIKNIVAECEARITPPVAIDACVGPVTGSAAEPLTYSKQGSYVINWKFDDGHGNVSTAKQTVTVKDTRDPAAPVMPIINESCAAVVVVPTAYDDCMGVVYGKTPDPLVYNKQGIYTVRWVFNDGNDNESVVIQQVNIKDIDAPVVPHIETIYGECAVSVTKVPVAKDACVGDINGTTTDMLHYNKPGSYSINWIFDDGRGNVSKAVQTVVIKDVTAPVTPMLPDVNAECFVELKAPTTRDECLGSVEGKTTDPMVYNVVGTYFVTWKFVDSNNNYTTAVQKVIIQDNKPPANTTLADVMGECSAIIAPPTANDACAGLIVGTTKDPLAYNKQGNYIINWSFDDKHGNVLVKQQNVIIKDTQKPIVPSLKDIIGQCEVALIEPTAIDACAGIVTGSTRDPLVYNTQGEYFVTWTFIDGNGNTIDAKQKVIVKDIQAPVPPVILDVVGECSLVVTATPIAKDACGKDIVGTTKDPLEYNKQGVHIINWAFDDKNGNISYADQRVVIRDTKSPTAPVLPILEGQCEVVVPIPSANDLCSGVITGITKDQLYYDKQGTYSVNWVFSDGNGNEVKAVQKVIVKDSKSPEVPVLADLVGECSVDLFTPSTKDECVGTIKGFTSDALSYNKQGEYVVTWKFDDGHGNMSEAKQKVIVKDTFAPVIPELNVIVGECSVTAKVPVASDACMGNIVGITSDPITFSKQGTHTINWSFSDGNGNTSSSIQKVVVKDTQVPATAVLPDILGVCAVTVPVPENIDACEGKLIGRTTDPVNYSSQGKFLVTWKFEDGNGNITTATQNVIVRDTIAPTIPTIADVNAECFVVVSTPKTTDNCMGEIVATTTDPVKYSTQGDYIIKWKFDDKLGNVSYATQKVVLRDVTPPVVPVLPTIEGECLVEVLSAPTAQDSCVGTIVGKTENPTKYSTQGEYEITWIFNDGNGNVSKGVQKVIVKDRTAPVVPVLADVIGQCSAQATTPIAIDACGGNITGVAEGPTSFNTQGVFEIVWVFNDNNGNVSKTTQKVIVQDRTKPVIPILTDVIGECSASVSIPSTNDECSGNIIATTKDSLSYNKQGSYLVTWSFDDRNGNVSTAVQKVIVKDTKSPVAPVLETVRAECSSKVQIPSTKDECSGEIIGKTNDPLVYHEQGTYNITWNFEDKNGNVAVSTQKVVVKDITAPVAPSLETVIGQCETSVSIPTTKDQCGKTIKGTTTNPTSYSKQGNYIVKWEFNDGNGNISTVNQEVIVKDTIAPVAPKLEKVVGECMVTVLAPSTIDACVGKIVGTTTDPVTYNTQGSFVINWVFSDGNGNTSTSTQEVVVRDTHSPIAPELKDVYGECSASATAPIALDVCAGKITATTTDSVTYSTQGTHIINWKFDDGNGNVSFAQQKIVIKDKTAPVSNSIAPVIGQCSATATAPEATDACMGKIIGTTTDPLSYTQQGTYIVNWKFDDRNGNVSNAEQKVIVKDTEAPNTIQLPDLTGECSVTATIIPSVTDSCAGIIYGTTTDALTYNNQGIFTINWKFNDGNGNITSIPQKVIVKDETSPIVPELKDAIGVCSVSVQAPTTDDSCVGSIIGVTKDKTFFDKVGEHQINWEFNDKRGNVSYAIQKVIVKDEKAPIVPELKDVMGDCMASVSAPTTQDDCAGKIIGTTTDPLDYNSQGTHVVKWSFNDGHGNISYASQNVIVKDITPPTIPVIAQISGQCEVTAIAPVTKDVCVGSITGTTTDPVTYASQGTYVINWSFDDKVGNVSTAQQVVVVKDTIPPVAPKLETVIGDCSIGVNAPTALDACQGTIVGSTYDPVSYNKQGSYVITWKFDDGNGNVSTSLQTVVVKSKLLPVVDELKEVIGECSIILSAPIAKDACGNEIIGSTTDSISYKGVGSHMVTWTFNDGFGNIIKKQQKVTIKDSQAPVAPNLEDVKGECSASVSAPFAIDACVGKIQGSTTDPLTYSTQGTHVVTWKFDDGQGNVSTSTQKVVIQDLTAPVVPSLPDRVVGNKTSILPPFAKDACMGSIEGSTTDPTIFSKTAAYTIKWNFDDKNGNVSYAIQNIMLKDTIPPQKANLPVIKADCYVSLETPSTIDIASGIVKGETSSPTQIKAQGEHEVVWTFKDINGNISSATQKIIIRDTIPPIKPILSDIVAQCFAEVPVPSTTDLCAGQIIGTTTDKLSVNTQGVHVINWSFDDGNGNITKASQKVIIKDTQAPVVLDLEDVFGECSVTVPVPQATDVCTGKIILGASEKLTFNEIGNHTVVWSFDDGNGNVVKASQRVFVQDTQAPEIPMLNDLSGQCYVIVPIPTANDACGGKFKATTKDPLNYTKQGTYIVHWEFRDNQGNLSTAEQKVIVLDKEQAQAPVLPELKSDCSLTAVAPRITDECTGTVIGKTSDPITFAKQGNYVINWLFEDGNGNEITIPQVVNIKDVTPPVAVVIPDAIGQCSVTVNNPITTDACAGVIVGKTTDSLVYNKQGQYKITWIFDDGNGNISTSIQNVIVKDTTAPLVPELREIKAGCSINVPVPTAIDACDGNVIATTTDPLFYNTIGSHIINWTFKDIAGNVSTAKQTIVLTGQERLVIPVLPDLIDNCKVSVTPPISDNGCGYVATGTTSDPLVYDDKGTYYIHWTFNYGNGHTGKATQKVVITGGLSHEGLILNDIKAVAPFNVSIPSVFDGCGNRVKVTTNDNLEFKKNGNYVIRWQYKYIDSQVVEVKQNVILK